MSQFNGLVGDNREVMPGVMRLTIAAPKAVCEAAKPGQFLHIRCSETFDPLLRRPFSLHGIDAAAAALTLLFQRVGRGTDWLAGRRSGETLDVLGPLGNGFELKPSSTRLLLIAGGLGQAPLLSAAQEAVAKGIETVFVMGARTVDGLLPLHFLPPEVECQVMTDDGSQGRQGFVTDAFAELLSWPDQIFACGPESMYRTMASIARQRGVRKGLVQISLEERMACGIGACYACVAETRRGLQKVCKDGPVFDLVEVVL